MKQATARGVTALLLGVGGALALLFSGPPSPRPASAPVAEFSAERAMRHVEAIARAPHPLGSDEHDRVRDYLLSALGELGLEGVIQKTTGFTAKYRARGTVENVVAHVAAAPDKLPGALMLVAHYDSVATGPGAADDGSGVAAILETLRALRTGPALRHDLIVLFTDGEERGLLGASAFVAEHPYAKDVRIAINLEAREQSGASTLFETSSGNASLVADAARPTDLSGSSLAYEIYKRMPNDTDVTVFKGAGMQALNFAFVGGWAAYHTLGDDPAHLDRGSLQQQGSYALGLARGLGGRPFPDIAREDAVFFSFPLGGFVHYGPSVGLMLAGLAALMFVFAAGRSMRAGLASARGVGGGFLLFFTSILVVAVLGFAAMATVRALHGTILQSADVARNAPYAVTLVTLTAGVTLALVALARQKLSADDISLGVAGALVILAGASSVAGASYLFVWPALALSGVVGASRTTAGDESPRNVMMGVASALPGLLILVPLVRAVYEGLGLGGAGGPAVAVVVALVVLSLAQALSVFLGARVPYAASMIMPKAAIPFDRS